MAAQKAVPRGRGELGAKAQVTVAVPGPEVGGGGAADPEGVLDAVEALREGILKGGEAVGHEVVQVEAVPVQESGQGGGVPLGHPGHVDIVGGAVLDGQDLSNFVLVCFDERTMEEGSSLGSGF